MIEYLVPDSLKDLLSFQVVGLHSSTSSIPENDHIGG